MFSIKSNGSNRKSGQKTILTIDDDSSIRELLEILLGRKFQIIGKSNGFDAMVWLDSGNIPDLIIADVQMPKLNGVEFLIKIKKSGFFRDVPIIFLSGIDDQRKIDQLKNMGAEDFISKPFNPNILIEKIDNLIKTKESIKYA